jgi:alcohol dehydrogenase class IV
VVADPDTIPRRILIDGKALATTPVSILRSTAIGQLRIAIESVYSRHHNPIGPRATLHDRGLATSLKPIHNAAPLLQVLRNAW